MLWLSGRPVRLLDIAGLVAFRLPCVWQIAAYYFTASYILAQYPAVTGNGRLILVN